METIRRAPHLLPTGLRAPRPPQVLVQRLLPGFLELVPRGGSLSSEGWPCLHGLTLLTCLLLPMLSVFGVQELPGHA